METDNKINIALIGCGVHSYKHANAIKEVKDLNLVSCCDINESRAGDWSEKYNCSPYGSIEKMLKNEKIDAVILCTWPNQHLEQIKLCLNAGVKNILCEKSLAVNSKEAYEIWILAKENKAFLMEACMYRHHPAIKKTEELVFNSGIGKIDSITAVFSNYEPEAHNDPLQSIDWRYRKECGGGVTHDWMSYCVNACNYFSGSRPVSVYASGGINKEYDIIDRLYGQIVYDNGIIGIIESSKYANFSQMLQISCAYGIIELPVAWGIFGDVTIYKHHRKEKWDYILTDPYKIKKADPFILQLMNFSDAIKGNSAPKISLEESVINIYTIEALINSLINNKTIDLDLPNIY